MQSALHTVLKQYAEQQNLPHFRECTICIEHIYDRCLPLKAVRDYDNLEMKEILDIIALYCMTDDTGPVRSVPDNAVCRFVLYHHFYHAKEKFSAWLDMKNLQNL